MMTLALDLRLDAEGDIDISTGDLSLTRWDAAGIAQRLQTRLRLFLGEWLLDTTAGVPWREQILVRGRDPEPARAVLTQQILTCPGIVALQRLDVEIVPEARLLRVDFTAVVGREATGLEDGAGESDIIEGGAAIAPDSIELLCVVSGTGGFFP